MTVQLAMPEPLSVVTKSAVRTLCAGEPASFRARAARFLPLPLGDVEPVRLGGPVDGTVAA